MSLPPPPPYNDAVTRRPRTTNETPHQRSTRADSQSDAQPQTASALKSRVAVLLGVERRWHLPLILTRACSTAPGAYWSLRCVWVLFWAVVDGIYDTRPTGHMADFEHFKLLAELFLAALWSASAAYLTYFFADSLMSRWLLNYTPSATLVRLFALNAVNAYSVAGIMHLARVTDEPSHLLPAWIFVATTLTALYRVANRSTNIKRETSKVVVAFSVSSFITMCILLVLLNVDAH